MRLTAALLTAILLSGCVGSALTEPGAQDATVPPKTKPIAVPKLPCPKPDTWTPAELKALGAALSPLKDDPSLTKEVLEWQRLRNEAHACLAAQASP